MKFYAFDIETIPNQTLSKECFPQFDSDSIKLGNIKDPAKKQAKIDVAKQEFNDKLVKKMSLDPAYTQLCTFVGMEYDTTKDMFSDELVLQLIHPDALIDTEMLRIAWNAIKDHFTMGIPIVTFNGKNFDLPVLFFRAIDQQVNVSPIMYNKLIYRYQNDFHYDLLQILSDGDRTRWKSLDFYLKRFGIEGKDDMDGSKVWPAFQNGEYDKIRDYCRDEVKKLCQLFSRIAPWVVEV